MNEQLQFDRAALVWKILISNAKKKTLISYKNLANQINIHHRVVRYPLDIIQKYCIEYHFPPLSILVVDRNGIRGQGFIMQGDLNLLENNVQNFNWQSIVNPFKEKKIIKKNLCNLPVQLDNELVFSKIALQTAILPTYLFLNKKRITSQPDQFINLASEKYNNVKFKAFEIIVEFFKTFPQWKKNPIQRKDVINLFKEDKKYLGFISAMIWGGINSSRPKEKGDFETIDFFRLLSVKKSKVEEIIKKVESFLLNEEIKECFLYLKKEGKIDGIDYPYFTKLMYFIGQSNDDIKVKPLIFDKWTSNGYMALLINSNNLLKLNDFYTGRIDNKNKLVGIRNNLQDVYYEYVIDMKKWSYQIGITSSKLEEFIFGTSLKLDKSKSNPRNELWDIILKFDKDRNKV